jgi:inorganic phosphate transporter, PiT family
VSHQILFVGIIVVVALGFDFTNGMHDSANSVATIVATRVLTPIQAVIWAAFWNIAAFFLFGTTVANTVGKGMIDIHAVTPFVVLAGLLGAIGWNVFTLTLGIPTSSSHAIIGAYAGAAIGRAGFGVLLPAGWTKTLVFIIVAPLIGFLLGGLLVVITSWILEWGKSTPSRVSPWLKRVRLLSAAAYSIGHGGNDAQKTMGIITGLLFSAKLIPTFRIPLWVVLSAYCSIGLGTLVGGWRIMKTMGHGIAKLRSLDGFCAELASATSIFLSTLLGIPVSTTHVITGAISGTRAVSRVSAVRWNTAFNIVWAWVFTIPGAALLAWGLYRIAALFGIPS